MCFRFVRVFATLGLAVAVYLVHRVGRWRMTVEQKEELGGELLARTLTRLGATFIKFGQILSTRPDLLGPGYIDALAKLQDQVPAADFSVISTVVDAELERKWERK